MSAAAIALHATSAPPTVLPPSPAKALEVYTGDANFMTSLARGLTVLETFTQQSPHMTISQLSAKTGLSRAAVRRCLYTLAQLGYVGAEDGQRYSRGVKGLHAKNCQHRGEATHAAAQRAAERLCRVRPGV